MLNSYSVAALQNTDNSRKGNRIIRCNIAQMIWIAQMECEFVKLEAKLRETFLEERLRI